jgi:hypothetical protein
MSLNHHSYAFTVEYDKNLASVSPEKLHDQMGSPTTLQAAYSTGFTQANSYISRVDRSKKRGNKSKLFKNQWDL